MQVRFKQPLVLIIAILLITSASLAALEFGARIIWHKKYNQWLETQLHGYDHVDRERGIIVPTSGTIVTTPRYEEDLKKHGKSLGLQELRESSPSNAELSSRVLFRINQYGLKGPEIAIPKPESIFRILAIGDSVTWGPPNDHYSYPRTMERELNRLAGQKFTLEVVNAGVKGDNFERVSKRIDEYLAVEPDLITIYLGWNRTIFRADPQKSLALYRNFALYKIYYHFIVNRKDTGLSKDYNTKTFYDDDNPNIGRFKLYSFAYDNTDLDRLVRRIKAETKSIKIVIITLGGLFDFRVEPDEKALNIGHPIASTNNLYAYAILTSRYNEMLRKYAKENDLTLIDFETYAFNNFVPRSEYFRDSVHLTPQGYVRMGEYFANELIRILPLSRVDSSEFSSPKNDG